MNEELLFAMIEDLRQELRRINGNLESINSELSDIKYNTYTNSDISSKLDDVIKEVKKIRRNTE